MAFADRRERPTAGQESDRSPETPPEVARVPSVTGALDFWAPIREKLDSIESREQ